MFKQTHGIDYSGDKKRMTGQIKQLLKNNTEDDIDLAIKTLLSVDQDQYRPHTFDHLVKQVSKYIVEGRGRGSGRTTYGTSADVNAAEVPG